ENDWDQVFGTTSKTRSSMIGVTVTIPLFAGGGQLSASREAYRRRAQSRDALDVVADRVQVSIRPLAPRPSAARWKRIFN
ncbi:TolC family protein, partial [Burkholderia stagnalis]|uniref:TolC family protein n=1 Tax=Burkholderia stagnalis TaxID=1503054 RepID=UPI000AA6F58F